MRSADVEEWERLSAAELQELDARCDRFEQAMLDDVTTRVEPYVAGLSDDLRRLALRSLLQTEIELRHRHGEQVPEEEYAQRFPDSADGVGEVVTEALEQLNHLRGTGLPANGRIGSYRLHSVLGRGGMGVVVRARDTRLEREVAIKVLSPALAHDATARERFQREGRAVAGIQDDNVVSVLAAEEIDGIPALVMELVDGETLEELLQTRALSHREIIEIALQVAKGLAAAHTHGLIHRDVKPGNILLTRATDADGDAGPSWQAKLADFGLVRVLAEAPLTAPGVIGGTLHYMSPEQVDGLTVDARSDLFSLGCVIYRMSAGCAPFRADSSVGILRQIADKPAPPLGELAPEIPAALVAVVERLMAKSPDERIQSATDLVQLLDLLPQDPRAVLDALGAPGEGEPGARSRRRGRVGAWVAGAVLGTGLLVAGAASGILGDRPRAPVLDWPANQPPPAVAPFDAEQARAHQQAWADHLGLPVEWTSKTGITMRLVPPGELSMGTLAGEIADVLSEDTVVSWTEYFESEGPPHTVALTEPFYLGIHEITQAVYERVTGSNPSWFAATGSASELVAGLQTGNHPVEHVTWDEARQFCQRLSELEEFPPAYGKLLGDDLVPGTGVGFRLPTEAQWEHACRAGTTTRFWSGDSDAALSRVAWILSNTDRTHPVGELNANPFGLHDVHGNVWEWVEDAWVRSTYSARATSPAIDPLVAGHSVSLRILRGGHALQPPHQCRSAGRPAHNPNFPANYTGFRVALSVEAVRQAME